VVRRVVDRMLAGSLDVVSAYAVKLKDLIGAGKEAALRAWEEALAGLAWQQMAPAGALRGVGCQMVSMGTFRTHVQDADIQLNLGWMVDTDQLRILLQARDSNDNALPGVELKVEESGKGVVFSRRTNQDGAMVAPSVPVEPGRYRIQIEYKAEVAETPYFLI